MSFLERRRLGRIGYKASVITLGGCGVGRLNQEEADKAIEYVLSYGVNMVDIAPSYGEAEVRLSRWVQKYRSQLFIAEKTLERSRDGALRELHSSLNRLGLKYFDLYQMHALGEPTDIEKAFDRGGALEAFIEARDTGLTRYLGITGHKDMRILLKALKLFDFDSVLLPVNLASMTAPSPENDFRPILNEAAERDIAVIAIKAIAKGRWRGERRYSTWYEPLDDQSDIDLAVWFTLSQEPVATYSLPCDVRLWPMVLNSAVRFRRLSSEEQIKAIEYAREKGFKPLFPENP